MPIFEQLQLEEALLRNDERNWLIVNEGSPKAIVLGISGKTELLVDRQRWAENPVPLIRRFSGGGTVFVDENTHFVTFIGNAQDLHVPCNPQAILEWTRSLYLQVFCGIDFNVRENDYAIGSRKFGGNAQYMRKNRWLHHSSLLWDYRPDNMDYLLMPQKTPRYREQRAHKDFLCALKDHLTHRQALTDHLKSIINSRYGIHNQTLHEGRKYLNISHRQATAAAAFIS